MKEFHFTFNELTRSETARRLNINNIPSAYEYIALTALVKNVLEPAREWYGKPIKINSGYRSFMLNKAVGGVYNSRHMLGEAADFTTGSKWENTKLYNWMELNLKYDQLILERGGDWIHVSYSECSENRMQAFISNK